MAEVSGEPPRRSAPASVCVGGWLALVLSLAAGALAAAWLVVVLAQGSGGSGLTDSSRQALLVVLAMVVVAGAVGSILSVRALRGGAGARIAMVAGAGLGGFVALMLAAGAFVRGFVAAGLVALAVGAAVMTAGLLLLGRTAEAWYAGEEPPDAGRRRRTAVKVVAGAGVLGVVTAALVGGARWRMHDLEAGDVARSWPGVGSLHGAPVVVGGAAYVLGGGRVTIIPLDGGRPVTIDDYGTTQAAVGDSGDVVTVTADHAALYDRSGAKRWSVDGGYGTTVAAIGDGDATLASCPAKSCELTHVDADGRIDARTSSDQAMQSAYVDAPFTDPDDRARGVVRVPSTAAAVRDGRAVLVKDGHPLGAAVPIDDDAAPVQARDVLVGLSHRGHTCHYEAVRAGAPLWSTDVDCTGLSERYGFDYPDEWVFGDRLLVAYGRIDAARSRVVVISLADGKAATPRLNRLFGASATTGFTRDAIVRRQHRKLTAYAPTTGRRLWTKELSSASSDSVTVGDGVVSYRSELSGLWPSLAFDRTAPRTSTAFLDARTGDQFAKVLSTRDADASGAAPGRALLVTDDRIRLVE